MKNKLLINSKTNQLNHTQQKMSDLFKVMHENNPNIFCEQISDRFFVQHISYSEVKRLSLVFAEKLAKDHHREKIGIEMKNSYLFIVTFWAIILSGNIPVLINTDFTQEKIKHIIAELKIKSVLTQDDFKKIYPQISRTLLPTDFDYEKASDEFILMSTGTTGEVKYSLYNGKSIANFINKSNYIVKRIPAIANFKKIKHLAILPFYHIFGLFAVYFWLGYIGVSYLFIENLSYDLLENIRRYKVTHIFATPLFFNIVKKSIYKEVAKQNQLDLFEQGLEKSIRLQTKAPHLGQLFARTKFAPILEKTFGNRPLFMISGGATIDSETLKLFNGLGYNLHTGYGATETGITSINLSDNISGRLIPTIGEPLPGVNYQINEQGILEIDSDTRALNTKKIFITNDLVKKEGENYIFVARNDEIITLENGENYNLNELQALDYNFESIQQYCFLPDKKGISFLFSINNLSQKEITAAKEEVRNNELLKKHKISKILVTPDPLLVGLKNINYRTVLKDIEEDKLRILTLDELVDHDVSENHEIIKIGEIIKAVLGIESQISPDADIFLEYGCTSFDFYIIVNDIIKNFGLNSDEFKGDIFENSAQIPRTINQMIEFFHNRKGEE